MVDLCFEFIFCLQKQASTKIADKIQKSRMRRKILTFNFLLTPATPNPRLQWGVS
jgi:hypothetical protein